MVDTRIVSQMPARSLRVDAERRRQTLLCAAASVFLSEGIDAPLENVAREAGVGIATLYRRFPTRDALVEAVFEEKMVARAERLEAAAHQALREPWSAFRDCVLDLCRLQVADPAFGKALLRPMQGSALFADSHARVTRASRRLLRRSRKAGAVQPDASEADLYLLATSIAALVAEPGEIPAERAARRMADIFLTAVKGPTP